MRSTTPLLALLIVLVVVAGCGQADDPQGTRATPSSTTTRDDATSSTPPPTTTTTAPTPTVFTDQARDAVNELKAAWEAGDRPRAQAVAPTDVVEALFAIDPGGFEIYGCDTGEFDTSTCNFRNRSTGVYITVNNQRHDQGWQVATIFVDAG